MASYRHYRSESVVSLIRADTDSKSGLEVHGLSSDYIHSVETFPTTTPVWEVTDHFLEAIEPGGTSLPPSATLITAILDRDLILAITARDQILSFPAAQRKPTSFGAFNSGAGAVDLVISQVKPKKESIGINSTDRVLVGYLNRKFAVDTTFQVIKQIERPSATALEDVQFFVTSTSGAENFRSIVQPPDPREVTPQEIVSNVVIGANLSVDLVARNIQGTPVVPTSVAKVNIKSTQALEQNTVHDIDLRTEVNFIDNKTATIISTFTDITSGAKFNEVEAQSFSFVKMLKVREESRVDFEYQPIRKPSIKPYAIVELTSLVLDRDTNVTRFDTSISGGLDSEGGTGSATEFPYDRGTVDYQIERYVLSKYIKKRDGNIITLDDDIQDVTLRDGTIFNVLNLDAFSPDALDNYQLGNAGLTLKGFEDSIFIDTGINTFGTTFFDIERMYGDQLRIEDFDLAVRGKSAVLQDGKRFNLALPTIQTPVTIASGGLVSNGVTVQSTEYFDDSGKLLFAHGDGTLSVYDYTGKTETGFTGLTLYNGSTTAISANAEIIPFQIV